uniref:Cupin-like domain-containing protein n=1 Tax=Aplanochytrium stocchinoi TaxID=215587 RepID=A0A7S3LIC7_9STRA
MELRQRKGLLVLGLMAFSLLFALSPSGGGEKRYTGTSQSSNGHSPKLSSEDPLQTFKETDYPVYENSQKVEDEEEEVTPLELGDSAAMTASVDTEDIEDNDIFVDQMEYDDAPYIKVLAESKRIKYRLIVLQHERYFRKHKSKLYVPRLKKTAKLSREEFAERFLLTSQPVIIPFEAVRHLNFTTKAYTLEELMKIYPNHKSMTYRYGGYGPNEEIDLGPAIAALYQNKDLKKTKMGRNFPRNTKVNPHSVKKLSLDFPPYVFPGSKMMAPSVWFGTATSSTKTHSDCCDNFAVMLSGTKRWTVAPPSEARLIKPKCTGGLCWVSYSKSKCRI